MIRVVGQGSRSVREGVPGGHQTLTPPRGIEPCSCAVNVRSGWQRCPAPRVAVGRTAPSSLTAQFQALLREASAQPRRPASGATLKNELARSGPRARAGRTSHRYLPPALSVPGATR